jgi:hypothetical protein
LIVAQVIDRDSGARKIVLALTHVELDAMRDRHRVVEFPGADWMPPIALFAGERHEDIIAMIREYQPARDEEVHLPSE